jgi:hypothetical protein
MSGGIVGAWFRQPIKRFLTRLWNCVRSHLPGRGGGAQGPSLTSINVSNLSTPSYIRSPGFAGRDGSSGSSGRDGSTSLPGRSGSSNTSGVSSGSGASGTPTSAPRGRSGGPCSAVINGEVTQPPCPNSSCTWCRPFATIDISISDSVAPPRGT